MVHDPHIDTDDTPAPGYQLNCPPPQENIYGLIRKDVCSEYMALGVPDCRSGVWQFTDLVSMFRRYFGRAIRVHYLLSFTIFTHI